MHKGEITIHRGGLVSHVGPNPKSYDSYKELRADTKQDCFSLTKNSHQPKVMPQWLQENELKVTALQCKKCNGFKSKLRRMRPSYLYITRGLAGLLNSRDSAVPTASRQSLFQNLLGCLQDPFWWHVSSELRVEIPRKGYLMSETTPLRILTSSLAVTYPMIAQFCSNICPKNLK